MADEIINADEIEISPRGRKVEIDPTLAAKLAKLKAGQGLRLTDTFGEVPKSKRATVSTIIRKHWKHVRNDAVRIDYTPAGVPQVRVRTND
jgi:hypothetical protein